MVFSLLHSYLTKRQQRVEVNNIMIDSRNISTRVPQGTILEPFLLSLMMFLKSMLG